MELGLILVRVVIVPHLSGLIVLLIDGLLVVYKCCVIHWYMFYFVASTCQHSESEASRL
jgi:hypothetical protein